MRGKIYIHRNKINGKVYVGQTIQRVVTDRFGKDGRNYKGSPKFWAAIKKYGWDAFETTILPEVYTDKRSLDLAEVAYIKMYDSCNNGYNTIISANIETPMYGYINNRKMTKQEYLQTMMTSMIT